MGIIKNFILYIAINIISLLNLFAISIIEEKPLIGNDTKILVLIYEYKS